MGRERSRSRSRSRSPRRKERRRSRSPRDRKQPDKKLDKFGRDISRVGEGPSSSSSRKRDSRDLTRESNRVGANRDEDRGIAAAGGGRERVGTASVSGGAASFSYYEESTSRDSEPVDERRQKIKEMFMEQEEELDEDTKRMSQFMGITSFDSTKGKKVNDQTKGYAKINRTQRYRQYMNRRGGFNRPLDWVQ